MALPLSGSREEVELVQVETKKLSLIIKGKPYHERYEGLKQYRVMDYHDFMEFSVYGPDIEEIKVYDVNEDKLMDHTKVRPVFFENGVYQLIVSPKNNEKLSFYHEHPLMRRAITTVQLGKQEILMGNLQFQNEVGLSTFNIKNEGEKLLEITLEIFPSKLDYKNDYQKLLEEVNEEIYNLAYHFIRKTYLGAKLKLEGKPSKAEFYRLIQQHFQQFLKATNRIEQQPHHQLRTTHEKTRGDQIRKIDSVGRNYLKKRPHLFAEVDKGIPVNNKQLMPVAGLQVKKELTYDTNENRYVKWMMERLIDKLQDLVISIDKQNNRYSQNNEDPILIKKVSKMINQLKAKRKNFFWRRIGKLDRSIMSLVLQMAPSYRDVLLIFLTVSKGLTLQGKVYQLSLKDVATLYEYWTFLKLGQILDRNYTRISQDVVQINREGLFVNLEANQKAERVYIHPITNEKIVLSYQHSESRLPTVNQKPDTLLKIEKKGKNYTFDYIFDAKYRVDYAQDDSYYKRKYYSPGPMEDDINTMHRYRDAIVVENNGPYERTAFGAYILFPWFDENTYQDHFFYKSIDKVNIGAFPFLPNATVLIENFIKRLVDKIPEELQSEGVLPRGTIDEWKSSLEEFVLVGLVSNKQDYEQFMKEKCFTIPIGNLKKGWQKANYVALYVKKGITEENGIFVYGKIKDVTLSQEKEEVLFEIEVWWNLTNTIKPVNYGIASSFITTLDNLQEATELPELFMKSNEEKAVWKMLRRVSDQIHLRLDYRFIDQATHIKEFRFTGLNISMDHVNSNITFVGMGKKEIVPFEQLSTNPSSVFRLLVEMLGLRE